MKKNRFRIFLIVALTLLAGYLLFPTFQYNQLAGGLEKTKTPADSLKYLAENRKGLDDAQNKRLKLGLDLQGGMHVVLEVDVLALLENKARNRDERFEEIMTAVRTAATDPKRGTASIPNLLAEEFKRRNILMSRYYYELRDSDADIVRKLNKESEDAVGRAKEIVRKRVDQYGVAEPSIQTQGGRRIIVELPGVSDKERVRKLLKGTALLEFKLLRDKQIAFNVLQEVNKYLARTSSADSAKKDFIAAAGDTLVLATNSTASDSLTKAATDSIAAVPDSLKSKEQLQKENPLFAVDEASATERLLIDPQSGLIYASEFARPAISKMLTSAKKVIPADMEFVFGAKPFNTGKDGVKFYELYALKKEPELTGGVITEASGTFSSDATRPEVTMKMNAEGTAKWARITAANVGKQVAIVLDGSVYSAPVVQGKIPNGSSVINGIANIEEANDLENILKAGALPAPVQIIEERSVGPSLGADSIRAGLYSVIFGFLIVAIFMVFYYRTAGFIADFALVFNIVFVIAGLAGLGGTLTLPGIAGLVLTIGMAVDANVLIFERVREEAARGKSLKLAVDLGYDKAFSSILDSHVTTLAAAVLLYFFGIGPVQGFAVTLMIGISASLFTALVITKVVFDWIHDSTRTQTDVSFG